MKYDYLIKNKRCDKRKLLERGFTLASDGSLCYRRDLLNGLSVAVQMTDTTLEVDVTDDIFHTKYAPFYSGHGGAAIKSEVRGILEEILDRCSVSVDKTQEVADYVKQRYNAEPMFPFDKDDVDYVYRTAVKDKWFALVMEISPQRLGLLGEEKVHVLNVKIAPEKIATVVDGKHFFPAYHMNKKNWITVLLDKDVDIAVVKKLLDDSYLLVEGK